MVLILKKGASKKDILSLRKKLQKQVKKGVETLKFCGAIKLKEDPLSIQNAMRNEWE